LGLVRFIGTDTFVLKTDVDADSIGPDELEERYRRNTERMKNISDISFLTSYGIKEINLRFFTSRNGDGNEYNLVRNRTDKTKTRILNVK